VAKRAPVNTKKKPKRKPTVKHTARPAQAKRPVVVVAKSPRRAMDELFVRRAMQELRTESQRGPQKVAWKVEDAELFDAAKRYCLDRETQHAVVEEAKPDLDKAGVSGRALISWLSDVKRRFAEISVAAIDKQLDSGETAMLGIEQTDQQHLIQTKINAKVLQALDKIDLIEGDTKRLHLVSRFLEHGSEVAKIRADAAYKAQRAALAEAKTIEITSKVRAIADRLAASKSNAADKESVLDEAVELLRLAIAGEDPKAHASQNREAA
jgi:hypothetical protein